MPCHLAQKPLASVIHDLSFLGLTECEFKQAMVHKWFAQLCRSSHGNAVVESQSSGNLCETGVEILAIAQFVCEGLRSIQSLGLSAKLLSQRSGHRGSMVCSLERGRGIVFTEVGIVIVTGPLLIHALAIE